MLALSPVIHTIASKPNQYELRKIDAAWFNRWLIEKHYLHRPIIRSKLLAHGIYVGGELVGGLLWATPHFAKKRDLFGFPGLPDKWEVLMLSRFYLEDDCGVVASSALMDSIGMSGGKGNRGSHRKGWRLQEDWCFTNPPKFPMNPFVPRLLMSYSDVMYGHKGTIYLSSGWEHWDDSNSNKRRTGKGELNDWEATEGHKLCWIMRLPPNSRAERLGLGRCNSKAIVI
jgi:hypothetical protein